MRLLIPLFLCALSCGQEPRAFNDRYEADAIQRRSEQMQSAEIVFVGVVEAVDAIGKPRPAANVEGLSLQLYRATCEVELVLKGKVPQRVDVWYFGPDPTQGMVGFPKFWLQPTQRRIFFVERSGRIYRALGDYLDYTEWLHTGKPRDNIVSWDLDVGQAIARLLLTPGQGYSEVAFAGSLASATSVATDFSSREYTIELLQRLTKNESDAVRREACRILASRYQAKPGS